MKNKNDLMSAISGNLVGRIKHKTKGKLILKIKNNAKNKGRGYTGNNYIEISNRDKSYSISSNENGKMSNIRISSQDEAPLLIIKIRPERFLRLAYKSHLQSFLGHLYEYSKASQKYIITGEVYNLKKK